MAPANGRCGCGASRKPAPRPRLHPRRARPEQLSQLARLVVAFHDAAAVAGPDTRFGEPAQVLAPALDNFAPLRARLPGQAPRLDALEAWTRAEFARIEPTLAARKAGGRIRECHGDLHLGNLVLLDGQVCPFDCIEFSDDLRWIDVASELAFTYMDLLDHRRPDLAAWLLDAWLRESGDFQAVPVLRFYSVYKALVRAKVAALGGAAPRPAATWPSPNPSPPRRRPG
jgi:aminoglycoside phosphotransferase family enzyme